MILIISYVFIISGFIIFFYRKKARKSADLRLGKVKEVSVQDNNRTAVITYSPDNGETFYDEEVVTSKKFKSGDNVVIEIVEDGISIYSNNNKLLCAAFVCWMVGLILCVFA